MNCCCCVIKYILFIFNLIFLVSGILLIVLGSLMLVDLSELNNIENINNPTLIPIIIIALGAVITILSFFGCCGSIMENNCMTMTYSILMFIVMALQIALVVWFAEKRESFIRKMGQLMETVWEYNQEAQGYPMNFVELSFKCCGLTGYKNYVDINVEVPLTCCGPVDTCRFEEYEHKRGCKVAFERFWRKSTGMIHYFGIGVAAIELIALVLSCCLAHNIRKSNRQKKIIYEPTSTNLAIPIDVQKC